MELMSSATLATQGVMRWLGALLLLVTVLFALETSVDADIWIYSKTRFALLVGMTLLAGALLFISRFALWSKRALALFAGGAAALALVELSLWLNPFLVPEQLLQEMPPRIIARAAALNAARADNPNQPALPFDLLTSNYLTEGYLRRLTPNHSGLLRTEDGEDRWVPVVVDEMGFRNRPGLYSENDTLDVLFLGDSFTRGTSRVTIAEHFSKLAGLTAYSLGDLGGAPQQWLMAFERFGTQKNPNLIIVNFYEGNDLSDAMCLQGVMDRAAPLDQYYGRLNRRSDRWVRGSAIASLFQGTLQAQAEAMPEAHLTIGASQVQIPLEHRSPDLDAHDQVADELSGGLTIVASTLEQLRSQTSAQLCLSYIPSAATVYADQAERIAGTDDPEAWAKSVQHQRNLSGVLSRIARAHNLTYVDVTPDLRRLARQERLYGDAGHFNQLGYKRYAELLYSALQESGESHAP